MSAGNQDDTMNDSGKPSAQEDEFRAGTLIDTRGYGASGGATPAKENETRAGTLIDTRVSSSRDNEPASPETMRDGS